MTISRNFLLVAVLYLLVGMSLSSYMGASGNHTLTPVHAHINLLGFTLMAVFAVVYRVFTEMAESSLAKVHFWLHQAGTLILVCALYLMMSGRVPEATIGPIFPVAEELIIVGTAVFGWNVFKNPS